MNTYNNNRNMNLSVQVILYIMLSFVICLSKRLDDATVPKSGPFNSKLIRTGPCSPNIKLTKPYDKNPFCTFYSEIYNTTKKYNLMRGNFSVLKKANVKDKLRFRGYQWRDGKWQIKYNFNNIACNGYLRTYMAKIMKLEIFEKSSCSYPKGTFYFEDLDFNQVEHLIWSNDREYGRMLWVSEFFTSTGTQFCWENEVMIEPA